MEEERLQKHNFRWAIALILVVAMLSFYLSPTSTGQLARQARGALDGSPPIYNNPGSLLSSEGNLGAGSKVGCGTWQGFSIPGTNWGTFICKPDDKDCVSPTTCDPKTCTCSEECAQCPNQISVKVRDKEGTGWITEKCLRMGDGCPSRSRLSCEAYECAYDCSPHLKGPFYIPCKGVKPLK